VATCPINQKQSKFAQKNKLPLEPKESIVHSGFSFSDNLFNLSKLKNKGTPNAASSPQAYPGACWSCTCSSYI